MRWNGWQGKGRGHHGPHPAECEGPGLQHTPMNGKLLLVHQHGAVVDPEVFHFLRTLLAVSLSCLVQSCWIILKCMSCSAHYVLGRVMAKVQHFSLSLSSCPNSSFTLVPGSQVAD